MRRLFNQEQTFIGPETSLEGSIVFDGEMLFEGRFTGQVVSPKGRVVVGEHAVVHGDIAVRTAIVKGELSGTIRASKRIELHPPARVFGQLNAPVIVVDAGVVFHGGCNVDHKSLDEMSFNSLTMAEQS